MRLIKSMRTSSRPKIIWHGKKMTGKKFSDIGNTPLVEVQYLKHAPIIAKAEFLNPTGSHKDRAYLAMILGMEKNGILKQGNGIVDYTTGNGGASCAFVGGELGYRVIITMPANMTEERKEQIKYYGAELVLTDPELFVRGAKEKAERIAKENPNYVLMDQSNNPTNIEAFKNMGKEILECRAINRRKITAFIGVIGTGANVSGMAEILKENDPNIFVLGVEAAESATSHAAKQGTTVEAKQHTLIGASPGKVAANTRLELIDEVYPINETQRKRGKKLMKELKLWLGKTSEANLYVAKKIAGMVGEEGGVILTIFYDCGWKYYSENVRSQYLPLGRAETWKMDRLRRSGVIIAP